MRYEIFEKNVTLIDEQNAKFASGESDHGAAINVLSDRTDEEKVALEATLVATPME